MLLFQTAKIHENEDFYVVQNFEEILSGEGFTERGMELMKYKSCPKM